MKSWMAWALTVLTCGCSSARVSPETAVVLDVTYVANEGFLIESGPRKVLVDALFGGEELDWCQVPDAGTLDRLAGARPPFDGVRLVLVTHDHVDHFEPGLVLEHLESNPRAHLGAPRLAVRRLRAEPAWRVAYEDRIEEVALDLFESSSLTIDGIRVLAHRVRHGFYPIEDQATGEVRDKHADVEQLVYVLELDGARVLHLGDAFLRENREYFEGPRIFGGMDLVFLEGLDPESLGILERQLAPQEIVVMHLPADPEQIDRIADRLEEVVPGAVVFREPMESRRFAIRRPRRSSSGLRRRPRSRPSPPRR